MFLFQFLKFQRQLRIPSCVCPVQILADAPAQLIILLPPLLYLFLQPVLHLPIQFRMEKLAENLPPLRCSRQQKLLKISLSNHGNLRKLPVIQSGQLCNRLCNLSCLCDRLPPVRKNKLCIRLLKSHSASSSLGPQIFRIPAHPVYFSLIGKGQLHKSRRFRRSIFTAEHSRLPDLSAGFSVQCKCNRVKNCGLSGPCISCNQVKSALSKPLKIKLCPPCIRAKSTENQIFRSHTSLSLSISSISFPAKLLCLSLMGLLFCSS